MDLKLSDSKLHFLIIKINKETDPFAKKPKWNQAWSIQRKLRGTPIAMDFFSGEEVIHLFSISSPKLNLFHYKHHK